MPDIYTIPQENKVKHIKQMFHNPELFARTLYKNIVYDKPAIYHYKYWEAIYKQPRKLAVIVPRGSAKTSCIGTIGTAYDVAFDREPFILMIKRTYDQAFWDLDNIKAAILWNDMFHFYFFTPIVERNAKDTLIIINPYTRHRTTIVCLGSEQEVRGRLTRNQRISKMLLDDVESEKNTDTAMQRDKIKRHIYSNAMPGIDPRNGKTWAVGTIVHYDSWLNSILGAWRKGDKSWYMIFAQARNEDGNPTWPSRFGDDRLKEIEDEYAKRGMHSSYYMEYMNIPIAESERDFSPELINSHFHNKKLELHPQMGYVLTEEGGEAEPCNLFLGVDPSTGLGRDFTGFALVAITPDSTAYVLEAYRKKLKQFAIVDEIWEINARHNFNIKGNIIEEQSAFKWLREAYNIKCKASNRWLVWQGVSARMGTGDSKESEGKQRIRALSYRLVSDSLYLRKNHIDLLEELMTFPKGRSDDIADAVAYATDPNYTYAPSKAQVVVKKVRRRVKEGFDWMTGAAYQRY